MELKDRQDQDLAFLLKYENVAWYENGTVRILNRSIYPLKTEYAICRTYQEVAEAIRSMITQSEGPYIAAAMGIALASYQVRREKDAEKVMSYLTQAAYYLSHARPTTSEQMKGIVEQALAVAKERVKNGITGELLTEALFENAVQYENDKYRRYTVIGRYLAEKIPEEGTILTQCFPGTVIGTALRECRRMGKKIHVYCAETRPYYQGARLTASVAYDMGFDTTVITDNMPAFVMKKKNIDLFTSASDVITMDGHVINKVGTFQIALAAHYWGIPYYCTGTPDSKHKDLSSVVIEERDPELVTESMGQKITMSGVKGYYPAFDITPPELITGIITEKGIYRPEEVYQYLEQISC